LGFRSLVSVPGNHRPIQCLVVANSDPIFKKNMLVLCADADTTQSGRLFMHINTIVDLCNNIFWNHISYVISVIFYHFLIWTSFVHNQCNTIGCIFQILLYQGCIGGVYAGIRRIPTSRWFCRRILTSVAVYKQGIRGLYAVQGGICVSKLSHVKTSQSRTRTVNLCHVSETETWVLRCIQIWQSARVCVIYSLVSIATCWNYVVLTS